MTGQDTARRPVGQAARTAGRRRPEDPAAALERALDEAVEHIGDLAERLWAVRRLHAPVAVRGLRGTRARCAACGQASPCPTLVATAQV